MDWTHTWQRPQQLASRLARTGRVLYVEPTGLRAPRPRDLPRLWSRVRRRLRRVRGSGAMAIASPLRVVPWPRSGRAARINGAALRRHVVKRAAQAGLRDPAHWVGAPSPDVLATVRRLGGLLVYDCMDDLPALRGDAALSKVEEELSRRADLVLATSTRLLERMARLNPRAVLVRNGCDPDHFSRPLGSEPPRELARLPRPMLGYVGEVADWLDAPALAALARRRPDWSVVLVGPVRSVAVRRRLSLPNVHLLGPRPYAALPDYVGRFDVCLIPFRVTDFTAAVDPVKLYEYLAAGRPVVSTPLPEVELRRGLVTVAGPGELEGAVTAALAECGAEAAARRRRFAAENSWDSRVDQVLDLLDQAASERS